MAEADSEYGRLNLEKNQQDLLYAAKEACNAIVAFLGDGLLNAPLFSVDPDVNTVSPVSHARIAGRLQGVTGFIGGAFDAAVDWPLLDSAPAFSVSPGKYGAVRMCADRGSYDAGFGNIYYSSEVSPLAYDTAEEALAAMDDVDEEDLYCGHMLIHAGSDSYIPSVTPLTGDPPAPLAISAVNTGTKTFESTQYQASFLTAGAKFSIVGSTGNDGQYTVASSSSPWDGTARITVVEVIPDATADGDISLSGVASVTCYDAPVLALPESI